MAKPKIYVAEIRDYHTGEIVASYGGLRAAEIAPSGVQSVFWTAAVRLFRRAVKAHETGGVAIVTPNPQPYSDYGSNPDCVHGFFLSSCRRCR